MTYSNEDKQLIRDCLKQDILAQKAFYHRFAKKMMGVCLRFTRTPSEAEDLLQEGFFKVFCDLEQFRGEGSLEGWVRKVIVNVALQHVRRRRELIDWNATPEYLPEMENSYEYTYQEFLRQDLLQLLQQLPEGCRHVFNLYVLEDYSHQEIAQQLNISTGTSKSQLSRARNLLKTLFIQMNILT